jgi:hypothetical protein
MGRPERAVMVVSERMVHREARPGIVLDFAASLRQLTAPEPIAASGGVDVVFEKVALHVKNEVARPEQRPCRHGVASCLQAHAGDRITTTQGSTRGHGCGLVDGPERGQGGGGRTRKLPPAQSCYPRPRSQSAVADPRTSERGSFTQSMLRPINFLAGASVRSP